MASGNRVDAVRQAARVAADDRYRWLIWAGVRLLGVVSLVFYPLSDGDLDLYAGWAAQLQHGLLPYRDFNVEYPPGALAFMALPSPDPATYGKAFMLAALLADAKCLSVLSRMPRVGVRGVALWQLLPLALGPIMWARLDVFVALAILLMLRELECGRFARASVALVAAASLKLWPLILVGLLLPAVPRTARARWLVSSSALVVVPVLITVAAGGLAGLRWMISFHTSRGLEVEALAALPMQWARLAGASVTVEHSHGSFEFPPEQWPWLLLATSAAFFVGVLGVALWALRSRPDALSIVLVTVLVVVATSKVLSPQYFIWVAAVVCLCVDALPRLRDESVLLFVLTLLSTQYVFPFCFGPLVEGEVLGIIAVTIHAGVVGSLIVVLLRARTPDRSTRSGSPAPDGTRVRQPGLARL